MKYIALILLIAISFSSCRKCLCKMTRNDVSKIYQLVKGTDTIYFHINYLPKPFDEFQDIKDSLASLQSQGYKIENQAPLVFEFVYCDDCRSYTSKEGIKPTCIDRDL